MQFVDSSNFSDTALSQNMQYGGDTVDTNNNYGDSDEDREYSNHIRIERDVHDARHERAVQDKYPTVVPAQDIMQTNASNTTLKKAISHL